MDIPLNENATNLQPQLDLNLWLDGLTEALTLLAAYPDHIQVSITHLTPGAPSSTKRQVGGGYEEAWELLKRARSLDPLWHRQEIIDIIYTVERVIDMYARKHPHLRLNPGYLKIARMTDTTSPWRMVVPKRSKQRGLMVFRAPKDLILEALRR